MKHTYHKSDFNYDLPEDLIARYPLEHRSDSRLLVATPVNAEEVTIEDSAVKRFIDYLRPEDLLVMNNTRVLPARLHGVKESGGKIEVMIERTMTPHKVRAYLKASKAPKEGSKIVIGDYAVMVTEKHEGLFTLTSETEWAEIMTALGEMPIPPYLDRPAEALDDERYQTVIAHEPGAVAAPTAGLHFDEAMLQAIAAKGIKKVEITLHVGAGTFQPVRTENLNEHVMHEEWLHVSQEVVDEIAACRARGGRVVAIGTTSMRALEASSQSGKTVAGSGDTNLFITPGYEFKCVDALFTNFHLPESTLIMLVSAFAGVANIRKIYQHAIAERYRFFSYGDAMFLTRRLPASEVN